MQHARSLADPFAQIAELLSAAESLCVNLPADDVEAQQELKDCLCIARINLRRLEEARAQNG